VPEPPTPRSNDINVKAEGGSHSTIKVEASAENSRAESSKKRTIANVIDISDDEGCETDGLTAEERAQYARLEVRRDQRRRCHTAYQSYQAKRRASGSKKEKHGSLTKKPKSEPGDPHSKKQDVIDLSD
jgi:hypothetical protein